MAGIRSEYVNAALDKAYALLDFNIQNDILKRHDFRRNIVLTNESLTEDEKSEALKILDQVFDYYKLVYNEGGKRICENCGQECLATLYCEHCVRNYLRINFSNWSSRNIDIDNLIQKCQIETLAPDNIIEWIPYDRLQNIKYMTRGGCSEIYSADWIDGYYDEWDIVQRRLKRKGTCKVVLKILENIENANRSWFEEAKLHLIISNKTFFIVKCFGLTQDPIKENYMLVMKQMDIDLRRYLRNHRNVLTWKEKIKITIDIVKSLNKIHKENAIHRDLHSGNILYLQDHHRYYVSDLGFSGPANKPLGSVYGNLPYIAPEVIAGKKHTFASDIYSFGMLMWEISSRQQPFFNFFKEEYNEYDLAMRIVNGMRPKIVPGTPLEYKELMEQCWDADPLKRPDIDTLWKKIHEIYKLYHQNNNNNNNNTNIVKKFFNYFNLFEFFDNSSEINLHTSSKFTSKIYYFKNFPEPRNAGEIDSPNLHSRDQNELEIPQDGF